MYTAVKCVAGLSVLCLIKEIRQQSNPYGEKRKEARLQKNIKRKIIKINKNSNHIIVVTTATSALKNQ